VSLELSSVCVPDATGKVIREATVASEPEALVAFLHGLGVTLTRVGPRGRVFVAVARRCAAQGGTGRGVGRCYPAASAGRGSCFHHVGPPNKI
jgi:hypothetical protein